MWRLLLLLLLCLRCRRFYHHHLKESHAAVRLALLGKDGGGYTRRNERERPRDAARLVEGKRETSSNRAEINVFELHNVVDKRTSFAVFLEVGAVR